MGDRKCGITQREKIKGRKEKKENLGDRTKHLMRKKVKKTEQDNPLMVTIVSIGEHRPYCFPPMIRYSWVLSFLTKYGEG